MMQSFILHAPVIGLLLFFVMFLAVCVMLVRPGAKQKFQTLARIPLKEDDHG